MAGGVNHERKLKQGAPATAPPPQGLAWIPEDRPAKEQLRGMLCRWVPAFSRALMCHLRRDADLERELQVGRAAAGRGASFGQGRGLSASLRAGGRRALTLALVAVRGAVRAGRRMRAGCQMCARRHARRACCCRTRSSRCWRRSTRPTLCCRRVGRCRVLALQPSCTVVGGCTCGRVQCRGSFAMKAAPPPPRRPRPLPAAGAVPDCAGRPPLHPRRPAHGREPHRL